MNLHELTDYVNLDVDDIYEVDEITRWFNKGIASYNLIPPVTQYEQVILSDEEYAKDYPLDNNFMLGIILPFINNSIMGQDAALTEKQIYMQEFMNNAREYKKIYAIPNEFLVDTVNQDLDNYRIGQNVFVTDMRFAPMQGEWAQRSNYYKVDGDEEDNPTSWTDVEGEDLDG